MALFLDTNGGRVTEWCQLRQASGLCNVGVFIESGIITLFFFLLLHCCKNRENSYGLVKKEMGNDFQGKKEKRVFGDKMGV